jgi:hypothetical protein
VTAKHTRADAIDHCEYQFYSRPPGLKKKPSNAELKTCADDFMREQKDNVYRAEADCRAGTITFLPTTDDHPEQRDHIQLPIVSGCAFGKKEVDVFRMLCPAYRGQIEGWPDP